MSYYKICPVCGSHLDPGEKCDCESIEKAPCSSPPSKRTRSNNPQRGVKILYRAPLSNARKEIRNDNVRKNG